MNGTREEPDGGKEAPRASEKGLWILLLTALILQRPLDLPAQTNLNDVSRSEAAQSEKILPPNPTPDPLEPLNRFIWTVNKGLIIGIVKPTSRVYRFIVRKPLRIGINNFTRNITYPGRLLNNLLQARWIGARDETDRFFCNTIMGGAGFVDVATRLKIGKSDADFGQTFGRWGWKPACYLVLPIFGPSNERDTAGLAADTAANPLTYVTPYPFDPTKPLSYVSPYTYYYFGAVYNNLSDSVDEYARLNQTEMDSYATVQYVWSFVRETKPPDFQLKGQPEEASLQTLQSVGFTAKDREFPNRAKTRSVVLPSTRKRLKFTYWLQPATAPVVYIVPGLGSHRLAEPVMALAEVVYQAGFSAVCVSSAYNYEFMEQASTAAMPAYAPTDAHDLHVALTAIDGQLQERYPNRFNGRALMGYSMGGFHTLFVAAGEPTNGPALLKFDRYVAIDSPVRVLHAISTLDGFYHAPVAWPATNRLAALKNTILKEVAVTKGMAPTQTTPPFAAEESRFLIGLAFRLILRDVIFSSQERHNQGILKQPLDKRRRAPVYREILSYSFEDYFQKFATPYYKTLGVDLTLPQILEPATDLRTHSVALRANPKIRLIVNRNDILVTQEDVGWYEATFDAGRLTLFEKGGHLGNLAHPDVQKAIVNALEGLKAQP